MDYRPLALGLMMAAVGALGALLVPAYTLSAFALFLLGWALYCLTPAEDRPVVLWVLGLSLAFRMVLLVALHLVKKDQGYHGFLSGDPMIYFRRSMEYLSFLKGTSNRLFNVKHGVSSYTYFCSFIIGLTRPSVFMLKVLNLCVGLVTTFGFYRWARGEFGRRSGLVVLCLLAFWPSLQYWSITNLKEPQMIFILMVALWSASLLCSGGRSWPFWVMAVGGAVALLGTYNLHLSAILGFAVVFGWLLGRYPRQLALASASALAGGIWLYWAYEPVAALVKVFLHRHFVYGQIALAKSDFAGYFLFPYDAHTGTFPYHFGPGRIFWTAWLLSWLKGLGYFLFSPFPWALNSLNQLLSFPQILLWYGLVPFVPYGARVLLRADRRRFLPLIVFVISLPTILALRSGNIGEAFRHRDWVSPFYLMFAGVGLLYFLREPGLMARLRPSSKFNEATD